MVAAQFHAGIDIFGAGNALTQNKEGLVDHGHQDAVDHEAWCIFNGDG